MTFCNLRIYTMDSRGLIEKGYVTVDGGRITAVGAGSPPSDADSVDCSGLTMTPGFIDAHTHLGIVEDSVDFEGDDCNEESEPITPHLRALDGINPLDRCFEEARRGGVTTVAVAPGSANPIGGQIAVLSTSGKRVDSMIISAPAAMKLALGENPKATYHSKNLAPNTRMATAALIRESLYKAKRYDEELDRSIEDEDFDEPEYDIRLEALLPLVKKQIPAHFHAHRADDIFTAVRIAEEFGLDYVIVHCTDGHLIADELAELRARAIVGPTLNDRSKPELHNQSADNPAALAAAGVEFALTTDHPVMPIQYLPLTAEMAMRNGLPRMDALRAITSAPAKLLGIESRKGSVTVGKDADLLLFDGDAPEGRLVKVMIGGRPVFGE